MGTQLQQPAIQDLKVAIKDSILIYPHQNQTMFLSNIDQVLDFHVQTLHFFPPNTDFPPEMAVARLRTALERVMEAYDFLGGRLKTNSETGRLEIECTASGAGFVVAASDYSLDEVGDLVYPNPAFTQLILLGLEMFDHHPLCVLQVTSFKCGGFALGVSTNHALFDGISFKHFLENLASQAFPHRNPFPTLPCHTRQLLAARSPPQVTFPHPELLKLKAPIAHPPIFDGIQELLDFKIFNLTPKDINFLKDKAKSDAAAAAVKITGFNVVCAHIWRCKALSCDAVNNRDRESTVLYAVDIRSRLRPPLPAAYCGNAVLTAYASAKCRELEEGPFWKVVEKVGEASARMTDEYARSAIDWGELNKGFPNGEFLISSWWRLGFDEVEYPWGKAKYSCPLVYQRKDIILLFPEMRSDADANANGNGGVNVLVALPPKEMDKFQSLFRNYFMS